MDHAQYEKILSNAIEKEIESQKFYQDVATRMETRVLKEMFLGFVREEKRHENILRKILSAAPERLPFRETHDYKVAETQAVPEVSPNMKPADAFALAMKKEEEAMNTYMALANGCTDTEQKNIFLELAAMEREHKFQLEKAFVETGYPEAW